MAGGLMSAANYVFGNMLLSAAVFIAFALLVMLFLKRFGPRVPSVVALPIVLGGALVIMVAWALSGIGGLALDIVKHMVLPVAYAHAHILRRDHAADPQQHAGDHPRGLRHGCAGQGLAGQAGP